MPFLVLSVLLRLLFFRGIVFVLDFFTELLFNHLGKGQDFCNIGSAEQKIVIFMHRIHAHLLHCVRKELCNSRIIKVKLTIIFSITRQAAECAIIDFLEDSSDEVFHSTKDTSPLRFGAIAEVLLLITHELFKQPQESRDDFHL